MIGDQGPGERLGAGFNNQLAKPGNKSIAILFIAENLAPFDPPGNDMMYGTAPAASILACMRLQIYFRFGMPRSGLSVKMGIN